MIRSRIALCMLSAVVLSSATALGQAKDMRSVKTIAR